ncbi:MAG: MarR family transcriptional regulator [Phycisphaeraceae bacterium]|nr:MarR family transcriptional regulator [Phycisphaeraceae bacterium]
MTESKEKPIRLTPVMEKFIVHWGEMGARWGINRTVAQIHALLYIWPEPLNAEQIAEVLSVARSNVSTSLRQLQDWGVARTVHVLGDRRDHFETMSDVWQMFQVILDERKKREVDPTLAVLRQCVAEAGGGTTLDKHARDRLEELLGFFQTMSSWYQQIRDLPTGAMIRFVKLGRKVWKLLGVAS